MRALCCWNWKCALLSATARSIVYLAALAQSRNTGSLPIVLVEILYVAATAGIYAGIQQRSLELRPRLLGNLAIVLGVPLLAQALDWLAHRAAAAPVPPRATIAVCIFAILSALFHLHVMRRGAFLTGRNGRTLRDDFRRMPRLILDFAMVPVTQTQPLFARASNAVESEATLQ